MTLHISWMFKKCTVVHATSWAKLVVVDMRGGLRVCFVTPPFSSIKLPEGGKNLGPYDNWHCNPQTSSSDSLILPGLIIIQGSVAVLSSLLVVCTIVKDHFSNFDAPKNKVFSQFVQCYSADNKQHNFLKKYLLSK